jgi:hypothetical protein
MATPASAPLLRRTLAVVYRFYDAFLFPINDRTPAIASKLDVTIPRFRWSAFRAENDLTYRFSCLTLTHAAVSGLNLPVEVTSEDGDYVNFEPIQVSLPLPVSTPPLRSDFLIAKPLWPASGLRPPIGETTIRGSISSPTAQPVGGIKVEIWTGAAPVPPPGTPYTLTEGNGAFLYRFPLLTGPRGSIVPMHVRLNSGALAVNPVSLSVALGDTNILQLKRT